MKYPFLKTAKTIIIGAIILFSVSFVNAAWVPYTSTPVNAPLTTGSADEVKLGGLSIGTFLANLDSEFKAAVLIEQFKINSGKRQLCVDRTNGKLFLGPTATSCITVPNNGGTSCVPSTTETCVPYVQMWASDTQNNSEVIHTTTYTIPSTASVSIGWFSVDSVSAQNGGTTHLESCQIDASPGPNTGTWFPTTTPQTTGSVPVNMNGTTFTVGPMAVSQTYAIKCVSKSGFSPATVTSKITINRTVPRCGDSLINQTSEQCDLGTQNGITGSGCSATCQIAQVIKSVTLMASGAANDKYPAHYTGIEYWPFKIISPPYPIYFYWKLVGFDPTKTTCTASQSTRPGDGTFVGWDTSTHPSSSGNTAGLLTGFNGIGNMMTATISCSDGVDTKSDSVSFNVFLQNVYYPSLTKYISTSVSGGDAFRGGPHDLTIPNGIPGASSIDLTVKAGGGGGGSDAVTAKDGLRGEDSYILDNGVDLIRSTGGAGGAHAKTTSTPVAQGGLTGHSTSTLIGFYSCSSPNGQNSSGYTGGAGGGSLDYTCSSSGEGSDGYDGSSAYPLSGYGAGGGGAGGSGSASLSYSSASIKTHLLTIYPGLGQVTTYLDPNTGKIMTQNNDKDGWVAITIDPKP